MEWEGGSKYMKMVVRETIAWATLERGDSSKPTEAIPGFHLLRPYTAP